MRFLRYRDDAGEGLATWDRQGWRTAGEGRTIEVSISELSTLRNPVTQGA